VVVKVIHMRCDATSLVEWFLSFLRIERSKNQTSKPLNMKEL
jgi:hypothetical protein